MNNEQQQSTDNVPLPTKDDYQPPVLEAPSAEELVATASPTTTPKRNGRRKINIEFIEDKSRRHITFSKRKAGIMKKAYELSTLTGTQVLLLVASETGHVYTFATPKLQPLITKPEGKNLIQACLNAPDTLSQAPTSHPGQLSPGGYSQPGEHSMGMERNDYSNQHSPSTNSPYGSHQQQPQDDEKPLPYIQRPPPQYSNDVKPFQDQHSMQENSMGYSPYPSSHHPMMNSGGARMSHYSSSNNGPSLPTLTDRGSFSNLPSHVPYNQPFPSSNMPSYNPQMNNSAASFPSHTFPSNPNQLFSKASNLPPLPRHDQPPQSGDM